MKNFKQLFGKTIIFLSFCFNTHAFVSDIKVAETGAEIRDIFHELMEDKVNFDPKKILTFFDCDDVLHKNEDSVLQKTHISNFLKKMELGEEQLAIAFEEIFQKSPKELVDIEILNLVNELQENKVPAFSLTQCTSKNSTRNRRISTLNNLGYNFKASLPVMESISFDVGALKLRFLQTELTKPVYDRGVIFAGSAEKGNTLKAFLDWLYTLKTEISPLKNMTIVFVDDALPNVQAVSKTCEELGISRFLGIHYTAVEQPNQLKSVDESIEEIQSSILKKLNKWLNDADAGFLSTLRGDPLTFSDSFSIEQDSSMSVASPQRTPSVKEKNALINDESSSEQTPEDDKELNTSMSELSPRSPSPIQIMKCPTIK